MHIDDVKSLESISRAEFVGNEGLLIFLEGREFKMEGVVTVNDRRSKTRRVPGTTYFPSDVERREERPLTDDNSTVEQYCYKF